MDRSIRQHLSRFCVGLLGCGGLGSNAAHALVRAGVRRLVLCDMDRVEAGNLNRQFFFPDQIGQLKVDALSANLMRLDPGLELIRHDLRVTAENLVPLMAPCDLVVEALDGAADKEMVWNLMIPDPRKRPLVGASGLAGWQNPDAVGIRRLGSRFVMCGDFGPGVGEGLPPLAPKVGAVACLQAGAALAFLMEMTPPSCGG